MRGEMVGRVSVDVEFRDMVGILRWLAYMLLLAMHQGSTGGTTVPPAAVRHMPGADDDEN